MADPPGDQGEQAMRTDTALIRELAELLTSNALTEIEVEDQGRRIRVRRDAPVAAAVAAPPAPVAPAVAPAAPAAASEQGNAAGANAVRSPMVGTVFLSPEPGAQPFVAAGQSVSEGDTLLIIEAMKVMNAIAAPRAGKVSQVLVVDSQPVEYDQPLIVID